MKKLVVYETKFPFFVGIISAVICGIFLLISLFVGIQEKNVFILIFCESIFGSFFLLSLYLIIDYLRRKFKIYDSYYEYIPALGKKKSFVDADISYVQIINRGNMTQYRIISHQGKRLASLEDNMVNCREAMIALKRRGIKIERKDGLIQKMNLKSQQKKNNDIKFLQEHKTVIEIERENQWLKIIKYILIFLSLIAFLLPKKIMLLIDTLILLLTYALYLYFYPRMTIEEIKREHSQYFVSFPILSSFLAMMLLLAFSNVYYVEIAEVFLFVIIYAMILLIPYFIKIRKRRQNITRIICVIVSVLILSFLTTFSINVLLTFDQPQHEEVIVKNKSISSHYFTDYYLEVQAHDKLYQIAVSKKFYYSTPIDNKVKLCTRKSIFGFEYKCLHD